MPATSWYSCRMVGFCRLTRSSSCALMLRSSAGPNVSSGMGLSSGIARQIAERLVELRQAN